MLCKERPYPRYHARQAVGFAVAVYAFEFLAAIVYCVGSVVTFGVGVLCLWVIFFLPIIPALYYAYLAYHGQYFAIPYRTQLMIKNGWLPANR